MAQTEYACTVLHNVHNDSFVCLMTQNAQIFSAQQHVLISSNDRFLLAKCCKGIL